MWATWSNSGAESAFLKAAYVQGTIEGLRVGATVGYLQGRIDESEISTDYVKQCAADKGRACPDIPERLTKPEARLKETMAGVGKVQAKFAPQNASVFDIVHQMDKFYSDYRNTPVCMIHAVQESIQSLNGKASTEQGLETMRKGCDPK
jgi:hypothetical protein